MRYREIIMHEALDPALKGAVADIARSVFNVEKLEWLTSGSGAEEFFGADDPEALIEIIHQDIHKRFAGGTARLHRILNLPEKLINSLRPGMSIGPLEPEKHASWTTQWTDIQFDALEVYKHHDDLDNYIVIEAEVPLSAVDIPVTICQNMRLWWEHETSLKRGHPIRIISIHRAEQYGGVGEEVRPDLWGKEMLS